MFWDIMLPIPKIKDKAKSILLFFMLHLIIIVSLCLLRAASKGYVEGDDGLGTFVHV